MKITADTLYELVLTVLAGAAVTFALVSCICAITIMILFLVQCLY